MDLETSVLLLGISHKRLKNTLEVLTRGFGSEKRLLPYLGSSQCTAPLNVVIYHVPEYLSGPLKSLFDKKG